MGSQPALATSRDFPAQGSPTFEAVKLWPGCGEDLLGFAVNHHLEEAPEVACDGARILAGEPAMLHAGRNDMVLADRLESELR